MTRDSAEVSVLLNQPGASLRRRRGALIRLTERFSAAADPNRPGDIVYQHSKRRFKPHFHLNDFQRTTI